MDTIDNVAPYAMLDLILEESLLDVVDNAQIEKFRSRVL